MQENRFTRTEMLIGKDGLDRLYSSHVAVFGVGGVGSFAIESLARAGVGELTLVDFDTIAISNLNRQIHALDTTVGQAKVDAMAERVRLINPDIKLHLVNGLYNADTAESIINEDWDYVIDAIDMVTSKIDLIVRCKSQGIPIISSMGTGNKMDPSRLTITDIKKTSVCPLARVMRREMKNRRIKSLDVVYSNEEPMKVLDEYKSEGRKQPPGSISFVPSSAGLMLTSFVVRKLLDY